MTAGVRGAASRSPAPEAQSPRDRLLGRDYWAVLSTPHPDTTADDVTNHVDAHVAWLLKLESDGTLFLSGPLTKGPGVRPGSGLAIFRAESASRAAEIAAEDPFVRAGLRSFEVFGWRLNEGTIDLRLSLGTGSYDWR
ncbi:MAG TPA: YciI family protein [Streptosporangiaceae bacterium]|nr:YciI family protein [Streptosporangiaceae bacterium]